MDIVSVLISKIPEFEVPDNRLCCLCNGGIKFGDYVWHASEENHCCVCSRCIDSGLKLLLDSHLKLSQKQELN